MFKSRHSALERRMEAYEITMKLGEIKDDTKEEQSRGAEEAKQGKKAAIRDGWQVLPEVEELAILGRATKYKNRLEGGHKLSEEAQLHRK